MRGSVGLAKVSSLWRKTLERETPVGNTEESGGGEKEEDEEKMETEQGERDYLGWGGYPPRPVKGFKAGNATLRHGRRQFVRLFICCTPR